MKDKDTKKKVLLAAGLAGSLLIGSMLISAVQEDHSSSSTQEPRVSTSQPKKRLFTEPLPRNKQEKGEEPTDSELYERAGLREIVRSSAPLLPKELKEIALVMTKSEDQNEQKQASLPTRPMSPSQSEKQEENPEDGKDEPSVPPLEPTNPIVPEIPEPPGVSVDYSVLHALILEGEAVETQAYMSTGVLHFKEQLRMAKQLIQYQTATQVVINRQAQALKQAMDQLVKKGDKTVLGQRIEEANRLDLMLYTTVSSTKFKQVFLQVYLVYKQKETTQAVVDEQLLKLEQAMTDLVRRGDKTDLRILLNQVKQVDQELYTIQSLVSLVVPMLDSEEILKDIDATQPQLDQAYARMKNAYDSLEKKDGLELSLLTLNRLIAACDQLDESNYTPDSFARFSVALTQAKFLIQQDDLTEEIVNNQFEVLNHAKQALVEKADVSGLQRLIDEVSVLQEMDYTLESWAIFAQALADANAIVIDENVTHEKVDEAAQKLEAARDALVGLESEKPLLPGPREERNVYNQTDEPTQTLETVKRLVVVPEKKYEELSVEGDPSQDSENESGDLIEKKATVNSHELDSVGIKEERTLVEEKEGGDSLE